MGGLFKYKGVHDHRARKVFRGLYSPDGWRNLRRPPGYRWPRFCAHKVGVPPRPCGLPNLARGYCRKHYDAVFRKKVRGMAARTKKPLLTKEAKKWQKLVGRSVFLRPEVAKSYVAARDARIGMAGQGNGRLYQAAMLRAELKVPEAEHLLVL